MEGQSMRVQFWESIIRNSVLDGDIFPPWVNGYFFNILKEIVDRYEGKIWEDFFTNYFEQVSVCMRCQDKLFQGFYIALWN